MLVLVTVPMLALVGAGVFVGYDYCAQEAGEDTLSDFSDCATDTAVNTYRKLWGYPVTHSSDASGSQDTEVTSKGTLETKTFDSEALNLTMQYEIYLPPGYDDPRYSSVRYPVVYLLPGSDAGPAAWVGAAGVDEQMDTLLAQGRVRPMILVIPQEKGDLSLKVQGNGYIDGPLGNWATYTARDLVDEIDSNYRTVRSREGRAIAGYSEGGYGAMNLGLKNPSEFGVIGSFSGYFTIDEKDLSRIFGGDQSFAEANSPLLYLPQLEGELPAIYFIVGQDDKHYLAENQKFAEELKARGASFEFHTSPGKHNWDLWGAYVPDFLVFASEHLTGGE